MHRAFVFLVTALLAAPMAAPALANTAMSIGVYLWNSPDEDPVKAQFLSISDGNAELEIDGPDGRKSDSRPATPDEIAQLTAAVKEQMTALSMDTVPQPTGGYVTVDWHFSTDTGYADGSTTFALDAVPAVILTLQKTAFGATFAK